MNILLWDTRRRDVSKDFAGGFGVGMYRGQRGPRDAVVRWFYRRDRRPAALLYAYLAAAFARLGHQVRYSVDRPPRGADLYVFNPSLITLDLEREVIAQLLTDEPGARVLVVGTTASILPEAFDGLDVTVVQGEAEQLYWRLDEVLERPGAKIQLGVTEDLDRLPLPDWTPLGPERYRIGYDFWRFPTGLVQSSRGCRFKCNYCPYLVLENNTRFRDPRAVAEEMRQGIRRWGFRSFKFRDPLFGLSRDRTMQLIDEIGRLPRTSDGQPVQFSIESRIELLPPELLRLLKRAGLTSVTFGVETPSDPTLRNYRRQPIAKDRQQAFIATCHALGIRTVAGFMIGFPEDTEYSIRQVLRYALALGPTFANFNVVTPYPGTAFFEQMRGRLETIDYSRFNVYTPMLTYDHLTPRQVEELLGKCFRRYYFRWQYLRENAALLWPGLRRLGFGAEPQGEVLAMRAKADAPQPPAGLPVLESCGGQYAERSAEYSVLRTPGELPELDG
jgi:anaerobic magnesium-protoporphyrin IX monomethyl ester cyclase